MDDSSDRVRILLVDDHQIMREGLRLLLEKEPGFEIVAEAENGIEALRLAVEAQPDVVILDVAMPQKNGIQAATELRTLLPKLKIVALTMHVDKNYLTGMLRAGTSAYLLKDCAAEELVTAIRTVVAGKAYLSPEIAPLILSDYSGGDQSSRGMTRAELTAKEIEVLKLLAEGMGIREIAERMNVSGKTIERSRNQIMEKLQLFTVAELTKYAVREGISSLN